MVRSTPKVYCGEAVRTTNVNQRASSGGIYFVPTSLIFSVVLRTPSVQSELFGSTVNPCIKSRNHQLSRMGGSTRYEVKSVISNRQSVRPNAF